MSAHFLYKFRPQQPGRTRGGGGHSSTPALPPAQHIEAGAKVSPERLGSLERSATSRHACWPLLTAGQTFRVWTAYQRLAVCIRRGSSALESTLLDGGAQAGVPLVPFAGLGSTKQLPPEVRDKSSAAARIEAALSALAIRRASSAEEACGAVVAQEQDSVLSAAPTSDHSLAYAVLPSGVSGAEPWAADSLNSWLLNSRRRWSWRSQRSTRSCSSHTQPRYRLITDDTSCVTNFGPRSAGYPSGCEHDGGLSIEVPALGCATSVPGIGPAIPAKLLNGKLLGGNIEYRSSWLYFDEVPFVITPSIQSRMWARNVWRRCAVRLRSSPLRGTVTFGNEGTGEVGLSAAQVPPAHSNITSCFFI